MSGYESRTVAIYMNGRSCGIADPPPEAIMLSHAISRIKYSDWRLTHYMNAGTHSPELKPQFQALAILERALLAMANEADLTIRAGA
jgi:hypothetical protein